MDRDDAGADAEANVADGDRQDVGAVDVEQQAPMVRVESLSKTPSFTPSLPELCASTTDVQMPRMKDRKRQIESNLQQHQHEKRHSNSVSLANANEHPHPLHEKAKETVVLSGLEEARES